MTKTSSPRVQVFVLAHNRPQLLRETLHSILSQDYDKLELIVSDNSTNDSVQQMVASEFVNQLVYQRNSPALPPISHFNKLLKEADGDYLVLFHDDDLMLPNFVRTLLSFLEQNQNYSAAAPNAYLRLENRQTKRAFYPMAPPVYDVINGTEMARHYLDVGLFRMPFPGYMYRTDMIHGIFLNDEEGGKHADVSFLIKVAVAAPVAWIGLPLFEYRIHQGNDSWKEDVPARLKLLRFIYRATTIPKKSSLVNTYRLAFWFLWWRAGLGKRMSWRRKVILRFLLINLLTLPLRQPILMLNLLRHRFYYLF